MTEYQGKTVGPDPAMDVRDQIATSSGVAELPDKIWFQRTAAAVIEPGRCVGCGGCIAACPSQSIGIATDGRPTLIRMCTGCAACWDYCPLGGLRTERLNHVDETPTDEQAALGPLTGAFTARARTSVPGAQDGGVVTALLVELLEQGVIDGAIVTRRHDAFSGEAILACSADEIRSAAGSVYEQSYPLALLNRPLPEGVRRLALVGTPCQISVLRALQRYPWQYRQSAADAVVLTVGLFCTRSFDPDRLRQALAATGLDLGRVDRLDVRDGQLVALDADGAVLAERPVSDFGDAALAGCAECTDFAALAGDLAVGNQGSPPRFTTVLVRSEVGADAWQRVSGSMELGSPPDLAVVARAAGRDQRAAVRQLHRGYAPEGPLWVSYSEHRAAYEGTDRCPVAPPPFRTQHYEESC
ncbi:MAG: Coenzyme F420 hydrogenase/dehydrogenase, beta subunit C-terminal domain [Chloroflexota bacterium]